MGEQGGGAGVPYEDAILGWSEVQAARLRRAAAGEAPPDGAGVDWAGVIDEIEGVGRPCHYTAFERLFAALRLVLMAHRWPDYQEAGRWLAAADSALVAAREFTDPGKGPLCPHHRPAQHSAPTRVRGPLFERWQAARFRTAQNSPAAPSSATVPGAKPESPQAELHAQSTKAEIDLKFYEKNSGQ